MPFLNILSWLSLIALVWLFRMSYIGWLGPWLLGVIIVVPAGMFLLSLPSMLRLGVSIRAPGMTVRGQKTSYTVDFQNSLLLPVHSVTLHMELKNRFTGEVSRENYIFRNVETSICELPLPTAMCGMISVRLISADLKDLLGFFSVRRRLPVRCECAVLPVAEGPGEPVDFESALASSEILKPKYGGGFAEDYELRGYRPGDPPNSIHWKLSSKTDDLIVRESLVPENSVIYLVLVRAGADDRGLEVLRWLSQTLLSLEEKHTIVADRLYPVENEEESNQALASILSAPMREPCAFHTSAARCIFTVTDGEVKVQ